MKPCAIYKTTTDGVEHYLCDECGSYFDLDENPVECNATPPREVPSLIPEGAPAGERAVARLEPEERLLQALFGKPKLPTKEG